MFSVGAVQIGIRLICYLVVLLIIIGIVAFPTAPLYRSDDGVIRDKLGDECTQLQFERYIVWERTLTCLAIGGAAVAALYGVSRIVVKWGHIFMPPFSPR
jgi:hypothetical protein